nr:hypothetical transcript [Hymenolepis microstoma]
MSSASNNKPCKNCAKRIEDILADLSKKLTYLNGFLLACASSVLIPLYPYSLTYPLLLPVLFAAIFFISLEISKAVDTVEECIQHAKYGANTLK